jgi:hypothetical protein
MTKVALIGYIICGVEEAASELTDEESELILWRMSRYGESYEVALAAVLERGKGGSKKNQ